MQPGDGPRRVGFCGIWLRRIVLGNDLVVDSILGTSGPSEAFLLSDIVVLLGNFWGFRLTRGIPEDDFVRVTAPRACLWKLFTRHKIGVGR
jgi:hypothetical protein